MSKTRAAATSRSERGPARRRARATPPVEVAAGAHGPLGMPAEAFLRDYWQKRPLLVRGAFPGFESPLDPGDLAGLACEDGVLARIVRHDRARDAWTLEHGPFPEAMFPGMPDRDWTLLVQDVDKWDMDVRALLSAFRFLPTWRLDDIMVSFAAPGGSVGAHVDQYDVFLLQGEGHRRWRIDSRPGAPLAFRNDAELRLLQRFDPDHDWVLGPGDMLYLPPGVPHHGVAEDACLTYSVGMRAPSAAELMGDFVDTLAGEADERLRYRDPDLAPATEPDEIDAASMHRAVAALNALRMNDPERLGDWFGRFITLYRSAQQPASPGPPPSRAQLEAALAGGARLHRHPWTRMAWRRGGRGARLYAAGEDFATGLRDARALAASPELDAAAWARLGAPARHAVEALLAQGHYVLSADDGPDEG